MARSTGIRSASGSSGNEIIRSRALAAQGANLANIMRMNEQGLPALLAQLDEHNIDAMIIVDEDDVNVLTPDDMPHLGLLDLSTLPRALARVLVERCAQLKLPVIGLLPIDRVMEAEAYQGLTDFVLTPANPSELIVRARRIVTESSTPEQADVIRVGDLVINPTTYDVSLRGKRINLRFKEYELLRLLANNPGRVYTREALLSQIWGYDYLGGTRTVDVHIRRLRSKIEESGQQYIETIWNVGYRFREGVA